MPKQKQIKPDKLIISEEVKSGSSNNIYTVNIYNNCVSCNCPAGDSKQLCKHIISTVFNNSEKIQNEAPEFFEVLLNIFEIKNSKEVAQEQKKELYKQIMFVDSKIAKESYEHTIVLDNLSEQQEEQNIIKEDINEKLADTKNIMNPLSEIQSNHETSAQTNIPQADNYKKCRRCRNNIENIKDVFCPVCGSYIKFAKSHKVFVIGFVVFFLALLLIPDSQDKSKEAFGTFIALLGMSGFIACAVSVFMFFADIVTMFKIRKKSGYKKSIFQEIKENQKEIDEKMKYTLKGTEAQTESNLTFTATIQTNDDIHLDNVSNIQPKDEIYNRVYLFYSREDDDLPYKAKLTKIIPFRNYEFAQFKEIEDNGNFYNNGYYFYAVVKRENNDVSFTQIMDTNLSCFIEDYFDDFENMEISDEDFQYAKKYVEKTLKKEEKKINKTNNKTLTKKTQKNDNINRTISYKMQGRHFSGVPFCNQNCKVAVAIYDGAIYVEDLERHKSIHKFEVATIINAQLQFHNAVPYLVIQTQNSEYIFEAKEKEILKMVTSIKETLNI